MAAGLHSLSHNRIRPVFLHAAGKSHGSHHRDHLDSRNLPHIHVLLWISGSSGNNLDAFLHHYLRHIIRVRAKEHYIYAEGLLCQLPGLADLIPHYLAGRVGSAD